MAFEADEQYRQGLAALQKNDTPAAITCFTRALELQPDFVKARHVLGRALLASNRTQEAVSVMARVPASELAAEDFLHLGIALYRSGELKPAIQNLEKCLAIDPTSVDALLVLGHLFRSVGNFPLAANYFKRARDLRPHSGEIESLRVNVRQMMCDWDEFEDYVPAIRVAMQSGDGTLDPSAILDLPGLTAGDHLKIATAFANRVLQSVEPFSESNTAYDSGRIKIGYVSPDFEVVHPVGRHMQDVFKAHDRKRFHVTGYFLKPSTEKSKPIEAVFDSTVFLHSLSDADAAARIRADGVEILIDLAVYGAGGRPGILPRRAAPVQVIYMGHSCTSGARFMDYMIVDPITAPPHHEKFYSEALAYLPGPVFNGGWDRRGGEASPRAKWGLPDTGFIFCAFNASHKITPEVFDIWMRLLREVPRSILWLRKMNKHASARLLAEAEKHQITRDRLIFSGNVPPEDHFSRLACADLFLDCFPYTGCATAADAVWAGLPVLTCAGDTFVARMAASTISAAGLSDLVVSNLDDYYAKALELAYDPTQLDRYRQILRESRAASPLFDSARNARHLEGLYAEMSRRSRKGDPPSHIRSRGPEVSFYNRA